MRYERSALSTSEATGFAVLAARGIAAVERLSGRSGRAPLVLEVRADGRISSARGRTIYLSAHRVRTRSAPYLHEIAHVLLPCPRAPEWFSEGLACYIEALVSEQGAGYNSHLFASDGNRAVDADARHWLALRAGRAVIPFIGRRGMPRRILEDRHNVAAPFYVLSHSFVKHLADSAGFGAIARLARSRSFAATFRHAIGSPVPTAREAWLARLQGKPESL